MLDHSLMFKCILVALNEVSLILYANANWGGDLFDKIIMSGYSLLLNVNQIVLNSNNNLLLLNQ